MAPDAEFLNTAPDSTPILSVRLLAASAEPVVVFTSLAELIVDSYADHCQISLLDARGHERRISSSAIPDAAEPNRPELSLPILAEDGNWSGTLALSWYAAGRPKAEDITIARLLIELAVGLLETERLRTLLNRQTERADNLVGALETNRNIGKAIGILMASHKVPEEQAFGLIRDVSQHTHRKIRDIAERIAETGTLLEQD